MTESTITKRDIYDHVSGKRPDPNDLGNQLADIAMIAERSRKRLEKITTRFEMSRPERHEFNDLMADVRIAILRLNNISGFYLGR